MFLLNDIRLKILFEGKRSTLRDRLRVSASAKHNISLFDISSAALALVVSSERRGNAAVATLAVSVLPGQSFAQSR